jgi:hypothetical protein
MIDESMTHVQAYIVGVTSNYFVKNRHSKVALGAYAVMPLTIGLAGSLDYIKLPLSCIVELAKGLLLVPPGIFSRHYSERSFRHLINSEKYAVASIYKLLFGWLTDLGCMAFTFQRPLSVPYFARASYYGAGLVYKPSPNYQERSHPSICDRTQ